MKILVLLISFIFSFEASLNELVNIRASKLNEAVYDVNFIAYTFYLLHPKAIRLVKDTFDFYYSKFDDNVDDSPKKQHHLLKLMVHIIILLVQINIL